LGREIALVAENVYQTTRSGANSGRPARERLINNFTWPTVPENFILCSEIATFSSGEEQEEMKDGRIDLMDGSNLSGIDFVILATGYLYSLPFLSDLASRASENISSAPKAIISTGSQLHNLHLDTFYIYDPSLAFRGVQNGIASLSFFDI
jgi:hypothetical protein